MFRNNPSNIFNSFILSNFVHLFIFPCSQRRRFGSSRRPGERITLGGGGHGHYPLDYDYYDSGDDHNLIFYNHNSIGNVKRFTSKASTCVGYIR